MPRKLGQTSEFERDYKDGQLICTEGEVSNEMFVLLRGRVRVYKQGEHGEVDLVVLNRGDFFGELSVLEDLPRDASARAVGKTRVLVISAAGLLVRLRRDPTFAFEILRRLSSRLSKLNSRLLGLIDEQGAAHPRLANEVPEKRESLLYLPHNEEDLPAATKSQTELTNNAKGGGSSAD